MFYSRVYHEMPSSMVMSQLRGYGETVTQKWAISPGREFFASMLKACRTTEEQACIVLLWRSGMHSSTLYRRDFTISRQGDITWQRPKTGAHLFATCTKQEGTLIRAHRDNGPWPTTGRGLRWLVNRVGIRAGYGKGISPLTFRHSRAVYLLDGDPGRSIDPMPINRVAHAMGCSIRTLERHYAKIEQGRFVE